MSRQLREVSDFSQLTCMHVVNERGVSWVDHQACGRRASFILSSGELKTPLCRTHAKLKCHQPDFRKDWKRQANYVRAKRILRASGRVALAQEVTAFSNEMEAL